MKKIAFAIKKKKMSLIMKKIAFAIKKKKMS